MKKPGIISSVHNPHFKRWMSLLDAHGVKRHRQCLVSGERIRQDIQDHPQVLIHELLTPPSWGQHGMPPSHLKTYELTAPLFRQLDLFGTKAPLVVCHVPDIPPMDLSQPPHGLEVVCPMGDPGNLGAFLRCCRAFDVQSVILLREAVHPFHPKVIRASSGAVFFQPLRWGGSMSDLDAPDARKWITALDFHGVNLSTLAWPQHVRLLIGEEGQGVPPYSFGNRVYIPQNHVSIPLNAAVAGSIALYAYRQYVQADRQARKLSGI